MPRRPRFFIFLFPIYDLPTSSGLFAMVDLERWNYHRQAQLKVNWVFENFIASFMRRWCFYIFSKFLHIKFEFLRPFNISPFVFVRFFKSFKVYCFTVVKSRGTVLSKDLRKITRKNVTSRYIEFTNISSISTYLARSSVSIYHIKL